MKKKEGLSVPLAKVDATVQKKLRADYDITGFPRLKLWKDGKPMPYGGPREADGLYFCSYFTAN